MVELVRGAGSGHDLSRVSSPRVSDSSRAFLIGESGKMEVAPPEGLVLPAMPVQQLRQQPAASLVVAHLSDGFGQPGDQRSGKLVHRLLRLAVLRLLRRLHRRPRQVLPELLRQRGPLPFQPVAQVQG